jgi:hypothetical protein
MEIRKKEGLRKYEYVIKISDWDEDDEVYFDIELTVNGVTFYISEGYDIKLRTTSYVCLDNQKILSEEDKNNGWLYADMLEQEFKKHMEYIISCM